MARQILGKVVPTGEDTYDNNRTYDELCIVMYNGQSYISKKETRGNKPDNTEYWQQLVEKPVKGADYFTEADKDEIVNDVTNDATNKYNQAVTTGIDTFNQNAERKTSDFNDNASEKTDTYNANADSTTQAFTDNANSKTEAYNTNATEKLDTYNSNHTAKLKEYNDNATSKLSAYNTNTVTKTTEYNSNHTDKLSTYDTNASNKVDVYNTNADERLEEYNTNADNKIAEYDEHSKELNNKIVSIGNDYRMVKDQLLYTGEATDTFIHVEDSAMAEMKELEIDGVCEQETTTGKNLLKSNFLPITQNGITISENDNGDIVVNGTITGIESGFISFYIGKSFTVEEGTYTSSVQNKRDGIGLNTSGFNGGLNITMSDNVNFKTATSTETNIISPQVNIRYDAGTFNNFILNPMLEKSSNATEYEPFTNGASPNPDYPQEIRTITDSLKVTSCGNNLLKLTTFTDGTKTQTKDGVTATINDDGTITCKGTATKETTFYLQKNYLGFTLGDGCFLCNSPSANQRVEFICSIDGNEKYLNSYGTCNFINAKTSFEFRQVLIIIAKGENVDITFTPMFAKGTIVASYEEYIQSQITAKLPEGEFIGKLDKTYKDTLRTEYFPEEGQYHLMLDKMVGKITFSSSDDWHIANNTNNTVRFSLTNAQYNPYWEYETDKPNFKSTHLLPETFANVYSYGRLGISSYFNADKTIVNWIICLGNNSTLATFKTWLSNNQVEAYYPLKTPKTIDLGVIDMPMSYKDITNIFTDSDLLPTINAKYYRVFDKTIQNAQINEKTLKQEITDLNATVSALDNRLKALETKTVEEPTESEETV